MTKQERDDLARAITRIILARWEERTAAYDKQGFQIIIHVQPGQTQARIQWPPPLDMAETDLIKY